MSGLEKTEISYIYGLYDPRSPDEIRYVGKSDFPWNRIRGHLFEARKRVGYKNNWIKSVVSEGVLPVMRVIRVVKRTDAIKCEIDAISDLGASNRLTNGNSGGFGGVPSDFVRLKMSESRKRVAADPVFFKKYSDGMKRRWQDPLFRIKCSVSHIGKKRSAEALRKQSISLTGRKNSKATIAKRRISILKSHGVPVVKIETGEWFDSLSSAARSIGCPMPNVRRSIQKGYAVNGFHFKKA